MGRKFHGSVVGRQRCFENSELLGRVAKPCACALREGNSQMEKGKVVQTEGLGSKWTNYDAFRRYQTNYDDRFAVGGIISRASADLNASYSSVRLLS